MSAAITAHTQPLPTTANLLASACNDRYIRLHSTESPPTIAGTRQDAKGTVLASTYVSVAPTAIIWDGLDVRWHDKKNEGNIPVLEGEGEGEDEDEDGDDIWVGMEDAEESEDDGKPTRPSKKKKH
jgi:ribosome biogenesis protein NSA1